MELFLKTPPACEPLTLDEVRSYLRISLCEEDDFISCLIASARAHVENLTGRALLAQQWQMRLKPPYPLSSPLIRRIEKSLEIHLPRPPLLKVESLIFNKVAHAFKQEGSKIILPPHLWEQDLLFTYWAGYGESAAALPPDLKMAVLMATRFFYDQQPITLPLLKPFKVFHLV